MAERSIPDTMRRVQYSKYYGGSEALEYVDVPMPTPKKGEILVKVEAASVNPVDWRIQDGLAKHILPRKFPYVPGTDVAGEVVSVGPGVKRFSPGDKVLTYIHILKGGSLAEYAIGMENRTVLRPANVSAVDGAAVIVAGYTALQSARQGGLKHFAGGSEHLNVLITGASGGVGIIAIQLWKLAGAHLTVTCGARNMELLKNLGADEVLDYKTPEGAAYASPSGRKYHLVLNCTHFVPVAKFVPQLQRKAKIIDMTPTFTSIGASLVNKLSLNKIAFENFYMGDNLEDLETVAKLMGEGKLKVVIDSTFPLEKSGDAWNRSIGRHSTGKIIVCPN